MTPSGRSVRQLFSLAVGVIFWSFLGTPWNGAESVALTGVINSQNETHMEGVLVSAKKVGGTVTVTVVTDSKGRYAFPSSRLQPGKYSLKVRAVGYDLEDPGEIELVADQRKEANLQLRGTRDLSAQLTSAEWLMSAPGTMEQKQAASCMLMCHSLAVVMGSKYNASDLLTIMNRMRNYAEASINEPGDLVKPVPLPYRVESPPTDTKLAAYLSSVNLSARADGKWGYELKMLPRLKGDSTRVVITEYDLPRRGFEPHDVAVDAEGMVWTPDFGGSYLGRLNPRTGEFKEWRVPVLKPGSPGYGLDIQFDNDGNPWFSMMEQGGVARFDKKKEEFSTWKVPPEYDNERVHIGMVAIAPDGKVWFKDSRNQKVHRLDPATNRIDSYTLPNEFYGMRVDSHGNLFLASIARGVIGRIDAETGEITVYPTPTPDSGSRRGDMDLQDQYWFGEDRVGKIGMFDTRSTQFKEWNLPPTSWAWGSSYDVAVDKNGDAWSGGQLTDYVYRLNPHTGQVTPYLMPTLEANMRRISVDKSAKSAAIWVGENHHGKIARLEALQ